MESTIYTVDGKEFELRHYGVKGMKWGRRKARPQVMGTGRRSGQATNDTPEAQAARKEARRAKAKKAAKVGAAVVGTALAAYGTYKLAKYMQDKRSQAAMAKANDYINNNFLHQVEKSVYRDGTQSQTFKNAAGDVFQQHRGGASVSKMAGQHNAKVVATGRQMYKDATNTRLDKGLAKVVGAGDAVGNAAKNAASKAKDTARKAKNAVLDTVNPVYEYTPGRTTTNKWTDSAGMTWTETKTYYDKVKKKRR